MEGLRMVEATCPWCGHPRGMFWDSGWQRRPEHPIVVFCAVVWSCDGCHHMIRALAANECKDDCPELRACKEDQARESILGYMERGEKPPDAVMDFGGDD